NFNPALVEGALTVKLRFGQHHHDFPAAADERGEAEEFPPSFGRETVNKQPLSRGRRFRRRRLERGRLVLDRSERPAELVNPALQSVENLAQRRSRKIAGGETGPDHFVEILQRPAWIALQASPKSARSVFRRQRREFSVDQRAQAEQEQLAAKGGPGRGR